MRFPESHLTVEEYVIKRIVAEARQSDMQNWMMDLNRVLLDCAGYTELAGRMQNWLTKHGCGNIYLFLNPDIFMSENMDTLPELPGGYLSDQKDTLRRWHWFTRPWMVRTGFTLI